MFVQVLSSSWGGQPFDHNRHGLKNGRLLHNTPYFIIYRSISMKHIWYGWCNFLWQYHTVILNFYCFEFHNVRWVKFIPSHVTFIANSKSEICIKIRWFFTKLQIKIRWLRFYGSRCIGTVGTCLGPDILKGPVLARSRMGSVLRVTQVYSTRYIVW